MSLLAPGWLALAGVAVLGIVALHTIATRRPPRVFLPTARFVPDGAATPLSRATRPNDLALLVLRATTVLLFGLAFAGPVWRPVGGRTARVILVDRSRSTLPDARDSALAHWRPGDALVLFDSTARVLQLTAAESLQRLVPGGSHGALSPALVQAWRALGELASSGDSADLVVVSPLTLDELDAASSTLLSRWPGVVQMVRSRAAPERRVSVRVVGEDSSDVLRPLVRLLARSQATTDPLDRTGAAMAAPQSAARAPQPESTAVIVMRAGFSARDSAMAASGAAVVSWPDPPLRANATAQGLWVRGASAVAPLVRLPIETSEAATHSRARHPLAGAGRVVLARWADGTPAAEEARLGSGCLRTIGIGVPAAGDVAFQPAMLNVARRLLSACDGWSADRALVDSEVVALRAPLAEGAPWRAADSRQSALAPWIALLAALLLMAELLVRRPRGSSA